MLLADLDHVDGPREARLVGVRRIATADEHAPRGIESALGVVVHVLAAHVYPHGWAVIHSVSVARCPARSPSDLLVHLQAVEVVSV